MENSGVKRSSFDGNSQLDHVKAVLIDVEGTITPSTFFKDVLVKHVRDNVDTYVITHFATEAIIKHVAGLRKQAAEDVVAGLEGAVIIPEVDDIKTVALAVSANIKSQLDHNRCSTDAGAIFYEMITSAFTSKIIQGKVYEDVPPTLKKFKMSDIKVYAYVECCADTAKLQLQYSDHGDLTGMFAGYYDHSKLGTKLGSSMKEKDTYIKLAAALQVDADQMLFLTSKPTDAVAAHSAGLKTCIVTRDQDAESKTPEKTLPETTAVETKSAEPGTESLCHVKLLSELFQCCSGLDITSGLEDTSPHKKQRPSVGQEADVVTAPKLCVETACGEEKKHAVE